MNKKVPNAQIHREIKFVIVPTLLETAIMVEIGPGNNDTTTT